MALDYVIFNMSSIRRIEYFQGLARHNGGRAYRNWLAKLNQQWNVTR